MNYKLLAPDPTFTGACSGVEFCDGIGICESEFIVGWLCAKGFTIIPNVTKDEASLSPLPEDLEELNCSALAALARSRSISLKGIRPGDKSALIKAITEVRQNE